MALKRETTRKHLHDFIGAHRSTIAFLKLIFTAKVDERHEGIGLRQDFGYNDRL
jgi:hypothetical protein